MFLGQFAFDALNWSLLIRIGDTDRSSDTVYIATTTIYSESLNQVFRVFAEECKR